MKKVSIFFSYFAVSIMLSGLFFSGCKKEETKVDNGKDTTKIILEDINLLMNEVYLWYDKVPQVNPLDYTDPNALLDKLKYKTLDRWSFVLDFNEFESMFISGEIAGAHGFYLGLDFSNNIRIAFIYPGTSAYNQGVRRGWKINKVNGTAATRNNVYSLLGDNTIGVTNSIEFTDNKGQVKTISLTKENVFASPIIYSDIIQKNGKKIGYLVFNDFNEPAFDELDTAFTRYASENIDELIVDLRYNGGGEVSVAQYIASMIGGSHVSPDDPLVSYVHNDIYSSWDTTQNFTDSVPVKLNLDRVVFISTDNTASASELLINGLKPYMTVELVGSTTHGKPVGMYAFPLPLETPDNEDPEFIILPISFKYTNASGYGDFYDGIPVDITASDDLSYDFGDLNEPSLKAALDFINGTVQKSGYSAAEKSELMKKPLPILIDRKKPRF